MGLLHVYVFSYVYICTLDTLRPSSFTHLLCIPIYTPVTHACTCLPPLVHRFTCMIHTHTFTCILHTHALTVEDMPAVMHAMHDMVPTCWDAAYKCGCGDCPDAPTCAPVSVYCSYRCCCCYDCLLVRLWWLYECVLSTTTTNTIWICLLLTVNTSTVFILYQTNHTLHHPHLTHTPHSPHIHSPHPHPVPHPMGVLPLPSPPTAPLVWTWGSS